MIKEKGSPRCTGSGAARGLNGGTGHVVVVAIPERENITVGAAAQAQNKKRLTWGFAYVMLKFPKNSRGVAIAFSSLPQMKKVLPAVFAISALWRDQIGMAATSGIREDPEVSRGPGSVATMPFSFNPFNSLGGHHV